MFDPIKWPDLVNHDSTPIRPLSEATVAKVADTARFALAIEAYAGLQNATPLFVSPRCVHFSKATKEDRA